MENCTHGLSLIKVITFPLTGGGSGQQIIPATNAITGRDYQFPVLARAGNDNCHTRIESRHLSRGRGSGE